jgi:hypothetical protein
MGVKQFFTNCAAADDLALLKLQQTAILDAVQNLVIGVNLLLERDKTMADVLDALTASVSKNTDVVGSAIVLIKGFSAKLAAAGTDPTKINALKAALDDSDTKLAAAVAENTVADPAANAPPGADPALA